MQKTENPYEEHFVGKVIISTLFPHAKVTYVVTPEITASYLASCGEKFATFLYRNVPELFVREMYNKLRVLLYPNEMANAKRSAWDEGYAACEGDKNIKEDVSK